MLTIMRKVLHNHTHKSVYLREIVKFSLSVKSQANSHCFQCAIKQPQSRFFHVWQDVVGEMARLDEEIARSEELRNVCIARIGAIMEERHKLSQNLPNPMPASRTHSIGVGIACQLQDGTCYCCHES